MVVKENSVLCSVIKTKQIRAVCTACNKCITKRTGYKHYLDLCTGCLHEKNHGKRHPFKKHHKYARPWVVHKKDKCEKCGFIPQHTCQLDVDHIDGDKKNNNPSNYQTLCSNCHRLKTFLNKDSTGKKKAV